MPSPLEPLDVTGCKLWQFQTIADSRGHLMIADFAVMPFLVRRIFFISGVPEDQTRANHAQRTSEELLVAVNGSILATIDDGTRKQEVLLRNRDVGLVIAPKIWRVVSGFSKGAVLAVFASHPYDTADQISDYAEFVSITAGN